MLKVDGARQLKDLEKKNSQFKRLVAGDHLRSRFCRMWPKEGCHLRAASL